MEEGTETYELASRRRVPEELGFSAEEVDEMVRLIKSFNAGPPFPTPFQHFMMKISSSIIITS